MTQFPTVGNTATTRNGWAWQIYLYLVNIGNLKKPRHPSMARPSKKLALCGIGGLCVGLCITLLIALPSILPGNQVQKYFLWQSSGSLDDGIAIPELTAKCPSPLRVYMYDLPRKYNFGLITNDHKNEELPWGNHVAPPFTQQWEVNKQHSVEYWMTVYLLDGWDRKDGKRAAVRVRDPEQAEVFFVPFFASLSFNIYGYNMISAAAEVDRKLQEGVIDILSKSSWWQASQGRDHVIVVHHPNAFRHYRETLNSSVLIVADFGRYPKTIGRLEKDIVAPYEHVVRSLTADEGGDPYSSRQILLYFQGRISRKDDGLVREKLAKVLVNESGVHYVDKIASSEALSEAALGMRSAKFCLHPAGDTPSSCRLFDAIVSHCVPVIVSDKIELPFEDDINYKEFSLFFSAEEAVKPGCLLGTLRAVKKEQWLQMWKKLKAVSHHFEYQHPAKKDDAVNMIFKQVQRKLPAMKLALHRSQRLKIADWW